MQFQKEQIKNDILAAAREEFREKGFEKASIRNITGAAKTAKSNVYNYFHDKDALFAAVVEPTLLGIESGLEKLKAGNPASGAGTYSMDAQRDVIVKIMEFVFKHEEDLKLLLFRSSGSSLSGFKENVIGSLSGILADWTGYAAPGKDIPEFFVRTVAVFYIESIGQMLARGVSKEQAAGQFSVFLKFVYAGWSAVLNNKEKLS